MRIDPTGKHSVRVSDMIQPERRPSSPRKPYQEPRKTESAEQHHSVRRKSIHQKLEQTTLKEGDRYQNQQLIGEGGTARVYAVEDINCGREVAIKILKQEQGTDSVHRFIDEVATTCCLQHPYIIPIYDLDIDDTGRPYIAMRRIKGESLADYIKARSTGNRHSIVVDWNDLVSVFLKVCDALGYAHTKGYVHQDIKPDNIMLGTFGQIFVIDWGSTSTNSDEVAVTPAYMSPQQAKGQRPAPSDDIHCLGATLFHCLIGRPPTGGKDIKEVWARRQNGEIDLPSEEEIIGIPPPLLTIAKKAMAKDPEERYSNILAMADDLRRYQAGQAVEAHTYTIGELIAIWIKTHRRGLTQLAAILVLLGAMGAVLYRLKLKEMAYWGPPIYVETFDDESWQEHWYMHKGKAEVQNGRLVTVDRWQEIMYKEPINGSWAIEFDGEMMDGHPPGDLSVLFYENARFENGIFQSAGSHKTMLQTGAWDNSYCIILHKGLRAAYNDRKLKHGQQYHLRFEVDNKFMTVYIDGKVVCHYEADFPVTTSYPGLYLWWPGKAVDNLKLYHKQVPEKVSVMNVADTIFKLEHYQDAINQYAEIERAHPDSLLAEEANYKRGLSYVRLAENQRYDQNFRTSPAREEEFWNRIDKAYETWALIPGLHYQEKLDIQFLKRSLRKHDLAYVAAEIRRQYPIASNEKKAALRNLWQQAANSGAADGSMDWTGTFLAIHQDLFPEDSVRYNIVANLLLNEGRCEEVIKNYPQMPLSRVRALECMNQYEAIILDESIGPHLRARTLIKLRPEKVETMFPELPSFCASALIAQSRYREVLDRYPDQSLRNATALFNAGQYEELLSNNEREYYETKAAALLALGQYDEVIEHYQDLRNECFQAFVMQGRYDEALSYYQYRVRNCIDLLFSLGRFDEIEKQYPWRKFDVAKALIEQGRFDEVTKRFSDNARIMLEYYWRTGKLQTCLERYPQFRYYNALIHIQLQQYETVIENYPTYEKACILAHIFNGDFDVFNHKYGEFSQYRMSNEVSRIINTAIEIDENTAQLKLKEFSQREDVIFEESWFAAHIILPFVRYKIKNLSMNQIEAEYQEKSEQFPTEFFKWISVLSRYLAGELDDQKLEATLPHQYRSSMLLLVKAMRAEITDDQEKANSFYQAFQNLPAHLRPLEPSMHYLTNWRLKAIQAE